MTFVARQNSLSYLKVWVDQVSYVGGLLRSFRQVMRPVSLNCLTKPGIIRSHTDIQIPPEQSSICDSVRRGPIGRVVDMQGKRPLRCSVSASRITPERTSATRISSIPARLWASVRSSIVLCRCAVQRYQPQFHDESLSLSLVSPHVSVALGG
jgi:hypothetical protein